MGDVIAATAAAGGGVTREPASLAYVFTYQDIGSTGPVFFPPSALAASPLEVTSQAKLELARRRKKIKVLKKFQKFQPLDELFGTG